MEYIRKQSDPSVKYSENNTTSMLKNKKQIKFKERSSTHIYYHFGTTNSLHSINDTHGNVLGLHRNMNKYNICAFSRLLVINTTGQVKYEKVCNTGKCTLEETPDLF